jgi:hypothetical protein
MMGLIARLIFGFISFQTMTMISGPSQKAFKPNAYRMLVIGLIASLHVGLTESFNVQQRTRLPSSWTSHSSSRAADVADTATTHANIGGENMPSRRDALFAVLAIATGIPTVAFADDEVTGVTQSLPPVMVVPLGDTKQVRKTSNHHQIQIFRFHSHLILQRYILLTDFLITTCFCHNF